MTYRPEIDGVRAIAVLAVMLYHANIAVLNTTMGGGYLGVDVLFVISGYLITGLVLQESSGGGFTYSGFYLRRARRLLPALLLVSVVTLVLGWWLMLPDAFQELGGSVAAAMVFVSNFFFLLQDSYVAESAPFKPFLHTWSLAVEEQFYLVYPVVLMLLVSRWMTRLWLILSVIAGLSFALAVYLALTTNGVSFYLFPTRIWELMAGAILAVLEYRRGQEEGSDLLSGLGLLLMLVSFVIFDDSHSDPSLPTLLPVIGTMLVIRYTGPGSKLASLLSVNWLVGLGLLSYSLYLWHQPLLVMTRLGWLTDYSEIYELVALVVSLPVAYLSWRLVEQPMRNRAAVSTRQFLWLAAIGTFLVLAISLAIAVGVLQPKAARLGEMPQDGSLYQDRFGLQMAVPNLMIVGDGHAAALGQGFDRQLRDNHRAAIAIFSAGCPYIYSAVREDRFCSVVNEARRNRMLKADADHLVIVARYTHVFEDPAWQDRGSGVPLVPEETFSLLEKDLLELQATGKKVYLVSQVPGMSVEPFLFWYRDQVAEPWTEKLADVRERQRDFNDMMQRLEQSGVQVLSLEDIFCDEALCFSNRDGWLYCDDNHVSASAAETIVSLILAKVEAFMPRGSLGELDDYAVWRRLEMQDVASRIGQGDIVLLGDSITENIPLEGVDLPIVNLGIGGDNTFGLVTRVSHYDALDKASCIMVNVGVNDVPFRPIPDMWHNYDVLLDTLPVEVPVIVNGVLPVDREGFQPRIDTFNQGLVDLAAQHSKVLFVDATSELVDEAGRLRPEFHTGDRLHLSEAGYAVWRNFLLRNFAAQCFVEQESAD